MSAIAVTALSEAFLRAQLETRDREIRELHVLLQNAQRLLPSGSRHDAESRPEGTRREEPNATHTDMEYGHRGFWQRLFGIGNEGK